MRKAIHLQTVNGSGQVSIIRPEDWVSLTFDNLKVVVNAYKDGIEPREDCLVEIVDGREVFQLTGETLIKALRHYIEYGSGKEPIVRFPNRFHYIIPDAVKKVARGYHNSNY